MATRSRCTKPLFALSRIFSEMHARRALSRFVIHQPTSLHRFLGIDCKAHTTQESQTGVIDLPHDDPIAVKILLQSMYDSEYKDGPVPKQHLFHAKVACLAHKYDFEDLKCTALEHLKQLATVSAQGGSEAGEADITDAIKHIYEHTGNNDTTRLVIVEIAQKYVSTFLESEDGLFSVMMADLGEFGRDMAKSTPRAVQVAQEGTKDMTIRYCLVCETSWKFNKKTSMDLECPRCNSETIACDEGLIHKWECSDCKGIILSSEAGETIWGAAFYCNYCHGDLLLPKGGA